MKKLALVCVLGMLVSCKNIQPGEFEAVTADLAVLAADVKTAAESGSPEFKLLQQQIDTHQWYAAFGTALALADKLSAQYPQIAQDVAQLRSDLRKLMTVDERASADRLESAARAR